MVHWRTALAANPSKVQTKCACGHSAAAHPEGASCVGVDLIGANTRGHRPVRSSLCTCSGLHDTHTVPAAIS